MSLEEKDLFMDMSQLEKRHNPVIGKSAGLGGFSPDAPVNQRYGAGYSVPFGDYDAMDQIRCKEIMLHEFTLAVQHVVSESVLRNTQMVDMRMEAYRNAGANMGHQIRMRLLGREVNVVEVDRGVKKVDSQETSTDRHEECYEYVPVNWKQHLKEAVCDKLRRIEFEIAQNARAWEWELADLEEFMVTNWESLDLKQKLGSPYLRIVSRIWITYQNIRRGALQWLRGRLLDRFGAVQKRKIATEINITEKTTHNHLTQTIVTERHNHYCPHIGLHEGHRDHIAFLAGQDPVVKTY